MRNVIACSLRATVKHLGSMKPADRRMSAKVVQKTMWVHLDFKRANQLAERLAALTLKDPIKGSVESMELSTLADVLDQWRKKLAEAHPNIAESDLGEVAQNVTPIPVAIKVNRVTLSNVPGTARNIYLKGKRHGMAGVRRKLFTFEELCHSLSCVGITNAAA